MSEKTMGKEMLEKLSYKKKNVFEEASADKIKAIYDYSEGYMKYLDMAKTEREAEIAFGPYLLLGMGIMSIIGEAFMKIYWEVLL